MWKCTNCDTPNSELLTKCEVCGQLLQPESVASSAVYSAVMEPIPSAEPIRSVVKVDNRLVWRQWLFANLIACSLMTFFIDSTSVFFPVVTWGCALGLSQWLVVRRYFTNAGRWGIATSISFVVSFYAVFFIGILPLWLSFSIIGLVVGFAQWMVVRHLGGNSGLWIFASALSWGLSILSLSIFTAVGEIWWQFVFIGLVYGTISGWTLLSIFQNKIHSLG